MAQVQAVRRLSEAGILETLAEGLPQLAALRVENPDLSLRELGALCDPPLTRSGVNHRLQRLLDAAAATDKG